MATATRPRTGRDQFLDALRAIAIVRVAMWHAFGEPILSWTIATMPVMFFIAGSLLINSFDRRTTWEVLRARLKRLLVPFWLFGAIVLGFLSLRHLTAPSATTSWSLDQLPAWGFPLVNPTASLWEAGWATSPLWYLRAYLWLLLLSPLLVMAWRRFGLVTIGGLLAVMMVGQHAGSSMEAGPTHWAWIVGDLGLYGAFLVLGFAHRGGAFSTLGRRALSEWVVLGVAATAVAWAFWPSSDGVVNHSYPALFGWGVAWLALALLARPAIDRAVAVPAVSAVVFWMTRRAMSIYLWHSPAIVGAYLVIDRLGARPAPVLVIPLVAALTLVAATATGWIEDLAAGRAADLWPSRGATRVPLASLLGRSRRVTERPIAPVLGGAVTALVLVATLVPVTAGSGTTASARADIDGPDPGGLALPPSPSGRPDPNAGTAGPTMPEQSVGDAAASPGGATSWTRSDFTTASLTAAVESWQRQTGIDGVAVTISLPDGERHAVALGTDEDGSPMVTDAVRPVTSVTKTMTAAIALQLVDEGLLDLDRPLDAIPGAGSIPGGEVVTVRQLLDHSSGLAPYQEAPGYDAAASLDPVAAVQASLATPLQWRPGTQGGYSNSGFLSLGLLIEEATGRPYANVLHERVIEPHALASTGLDGTQTAGWVGASAGGVMSSVDDLATWGEALYRDGAVMSADSLAAMVAIDKTLVSGLGTFPVCPCSPNGDGTLAATSIGHNGGSVTLQFSPGDGIVIAAAFSESFWTTSFDQAAVYQLLAIVRGHVSS